MSFVSAFAISTLAPPLRGIHLLWNGPPEFLFAPGGWRIERRVARPNHRPQPLCDELGAAELNRLRSRLELRIAHGWLRLTEGAWPGPDPGPCEVFTLDLDTPGSGISGRYRGLHGLAIALNRGKAVGFQVLLSALDGRAFDFGGAHADQVVVYGVRAQELRLCIGPPPDWRDGEEIARLQLPLREFDPGLGGAQDELAAATGRLVAGEAIEAARFAELADILRVAMAGPGRRPIDNLLRLASAAGDPEDLNALDPLRALTASPKWRRAMGLSFIDRDPALNEGEHYDYRIVGLFPESEIGARSFGFHAVPPGAMLPSFFLIDGCAFRLPAPVKVGVSPGIPEAPDRWTTRLGVPLAPRGVLPWLGQGIGAFSLSIDLPEPVLALTLELDAGHDLTFEAGNPAAGMSPPQPVPPGPRPVLHFAAPSSRVNLAGKGFLFTVRPGEDAGAEMTEVATIVQDVTFAETPLPPEPLSVMVENLQRPDDAPPDPSPGVVARLHVPGIRVAWRPAPAADAPVWPTDLDVPAPLDAAAFEVERRVGAGGAFAPVLPGEDNRMFGADLAEVYSGARRGGGDGVARYDDTFRTPDEADPAKREPPPLGALLRYRVRTRDAIGRPSPDWRQSDEIRLEKHVPPPAPAAFDPVPADELAGPDFTGVYARVLEKGAPGLTAEDLATLGASDNAILLRWGWHAPQRAEDPAATGFRVYLSPTYDTVPGEILAVAPVAATPGDYELSVRAAKPLAENAARGLSIQAGYPFFVVEHAAGDQITMLVRTRVPGPDGRFRVPALGSVNLPLRLAPAMNHPTTWTERFVFPSGLTQLPITAATQYEAVIRARLDLSEDHPRDSLWVGVTSADSEPYVPDSFPNAGPDGPLPGNESRVVAVRADGRFAARPDFSPPPPAGPVPRLLTSEPVDGQTVRHSLDLGLHVEAAGLPAGVLVQPERASVAALFGTLGLDGAQLVAGPALVRGPAAAPLPVTLPNPGDQALVVDAVTAGASAGLPDHLAVLLAALHPFADTLFTAATPAPIPFGPFDQALPGSEERYLYRLRRADGLKRLSQSAAVANVVLRVPSPVPGATPRRLPPQAGDPPRRLRLRVPRDPRLTDLVTFRRVTAPGAAVAAELLRLANREDLDAAGTLRLRLGDGEVLAPEAVALAAADQDDEGWVVTVELDDAEAGQSVDLWASTLTEDRVPSPPGGPWRVTTPKAPLTAPVLSVAASPVALSFTWTFPDPLIVRSWLERSADGAAWVRVSPVLRAPAAAATVSPGGDPRRYRVVAFSLDGRRAESDGVEV